jgi:hypothetical protein
MAKTEVPTYDRVFEWEKNPKRLHLNGKPCRVLAYGATRHSTLVEFETGERVVTSARALRSKT